MKPQRLQLDDRNFAAVFPQKPAYKINEHQVIL
jgi:hypothetical protein